MDRGPPDRRRDPQGNAQHASRLRRACSALARGARPRRGGDPRPCGTRRRAGSAPAGTVAAGGASLVTGRVLLVGAGPGDPELITVRGARALAEADVVVFDRLAAPALVDLAPATAERIYVGKEPGRAATPQREIEQILVARALSGATVVRLKGGDPFVFGRGGEELAACAEAGIPCEV